MVSIIPKNHHLAIGSAKYLERSEHVVTLLLYLLLPSNLLTETCMFFYYWKF
ncbi:unnamed protein product [Moneuplotes crassus]|uniref:Uncharacterized protein n=1 Tax=Euplotes crassus TaxID=5936 RepID=A0AAD1Y9S6_EUPCR|nr:unnamed protein product [Moneuplotes crassus]